MVKSIKLIVRERECVGMNGEKSTKSSIFVIRTICEEGSMGKLWESYLFIAL